MTKLTDAEWAVLDVLWAAEPPAEDAPAAAPQPGLALGEVVDALRPATGWSRNTVHTYLTRMEGKGLVGIDRTADPHRYTAAVTREACARDARKGFLRTVYGGAAGDLVAAFLKESRISAAERDELRRLLDEMEV